MDPSLSINRGWQGRRGHYIQLNAVELEIDLKPETVEGCISQRQPFCVRVRGRGGTGIPGGGSVVWKLGRALCGREFARGRHSLKCFPQAGVLHNQ